MSTKPRALARRAAQVLAATAIAGSGILVAAGPASANTIITVAPNTTRGPSGGGNSLVITGSSVFPSSHDTPGTNLYIQFQRKSAAGSICAPTYQPPGAGVVVDVPAGDITAIGAGTATIVVPAGVVVAGGSQTTDYNICIYDSTSNANSLTEAWAGTAAGAPYRVVTRLALSPQSGPAAGANTLTLTAPTGSTVFSSGVSVQFQVENPAAPDGYCAATYQVNGTVSTTAGVVSVATANVGLISGNKALVTVPASIGNSTTPAFHVCVYSGVYASLGAAEGLPLIAGEGTLYTVGVPATIASISPAAGPAQGGNTITVTGTGFEASGMTATLGGVSIPVTYVNGTTFTSVLPARAAGGPYKLAVTTSAGTVQSRAGLYSFSNGITVTPNTAPNTSLTKIWTSVVGTGFANMSFSNATGAAPNGTGAHVYLVKGVYDGRTGAAAGTKANGQTAECVSVVVVQDTELVCELWLAGNQTNQTTRTFAGCSAVSSGATAITGPTGSTTCMFTPDDIGRQVSSNAAGAIPTGTTITAVAANGLSATLSKAAALAITATTPTFTVATTRTITAATVDDDTDQVSATTATGPFTSNDVGRLVTGSGIPAGTFVTAVSAGGAATLSNLPTSNNATNVALTLYSPVPVGVYTVTVVSNGAVNAPATDNAFSQSVVTSGSTFTVADY